jgi:DNA-binding XRE family transcriptional regulator
MATLNVDATPRQLRAARVLAGLTQAELAKKAGISRASLVAIEAGEAEPRLATYRALLLALEAAGVRISEDGVERMPPHNPAVA